MTKLKLLVALFSIFYAFGVSNSAFAQQKTAAPTFLPQSEPAKNQVTEKLNSCEISSYSTRVDLGGVLDFNDLRIRINGFGDDIMYVTLRAPGHADSNINLYLNNPLTAKLCKKDVTITYFLQDIYYRSIRVAVF